MKFTSVVRFADFKKKVHDRCARYNGNEVESSGREITRNKEFVNWAGHDSLTSGRQSIYYLFYVCVCQ